MSINKKVLTTALAWLGSAAAILSGTIDVYEHTRPKPAVHMWIRKDPVWIAPTVGGPEIEQNFGAVTVTISNDTNSSIEKPILQFRGLSDFKGIVVAPSDRTRGIVPETLAATWLPPKPDNPQISLPAMTVNDGLTVQAFGSNFDAVDPILIGVRSEDVDKVWSIAHDDSLVHYWLYVHHGWLVLAALLMMCCVVLLFRKTAAVTP